MPSTDTDDTPLFILSADEVARLLPLIRGGCPWAYERRERDFFQTKFRTFINDPQVVEWLNAQKVKDA